MPEFINDEFSRTLWTHVCHMMNVDRPRAARVVHLAMGYERGIDQDEILERIEKGELEPWEA